jgi:lysozyme family protein
MIPSTYEACRDWVWQYDGFQDDRAQGEAFATAWGITQYTVDYAEQQGIIASGPTEILTRDEADAILRALYWNALHLSSMPPGVNLMLFNDGALTGVGHTARLLQRIIGTDVDGIVGPHTILKANSFGDKALINALTDADEIYLKALANAPLYINGWLRRENDAKATAYQMAGVPPQGNLI